MKCKKSLAGFAALLIVFYHFWIPLSTSAIETNIYRSTYIGVDIFFFVSAYSQAQRKQSSYLKFIVNRFEYIYAPFVVMAVICGIYKHWKLSRLALVVSGAEFFKRGGGSFLWFIVGIMLFYFIAPFIIRLKEKNGPITFLSVIFVWLMLVITLQYVFAYTPIFILLNRIPIFLLGMYYDDIRRAVPKKLKLPFILAGLIVGGILVYKFGAGTKLMKPLIDIYYVVAVPFTLAVVGLFDYISQRSSVKNIPFTFVGGITLELYGMQMIFGYDIEKKLLRLFKNLDISAWMTKLIPCVLTVCLLIIIAWLFAGLKKMVLNKVGKIGGKKV